MDTEALADVRRRVAFLEASLLTAREDERITKLGAEQRVLDGYDGDEKRLGPNEKARERVLALHLEQDPIYVAVRDRVRDTQGKLLISRAELDVLLDGRRQAQMELTRDLIQVGLIERDGSVNTALVAATEQMARELAIIRQELIGLARGTSSLRTKSI
jgi:hypothetical protein